MRNALENNFIQADATYKLYASKVLTNKRPVTGNLTQILTPKSTGGTREARKNVQTPKVIIENNRPSNSNYCKKPLNRTSNRTLNGTRKSKILLIGKNVNLNNLSAAPKVYYTGMWSNSTKIDNVKDFLKEFEAFEVEELKTQHSRFKSFKFSCDRRYHENLTQCDSWPNGVTLRYFYEKRTRQVNVKDREIEPKPSTQAVSDNRNNNSEL